MLKNKELYGLQRGLSMCGHLTGVKFAYAIAKNHRLVDQELETLQAALKPTEKYNEFDEKRAKLAEKFSKKDKEGKAEMITNQNSIQEYVIEDQEGFDKEIKVLQDEYKDEIKARESQIEDYKKLLEEESTLELHMINQDLVPDGIAVSAMELLMPIIDETNSVIQE